MRNPSVALHEPVAVMRAHCRKNVCPAAASTLGIDPIAPLPRIAIPQPASVGSTTWNVPNAPTLAGLQVHAQALLRNLPLQARLTNVTADVLIR